MVRMCRKQNGEPCGAPKTHASPKSEPLMAKKEIEKKYLIRENGETHLTGEFLWLFPSVDALICEAKAKGERIIQGYLPMACAKALSIEANFEVDFRPWEARLRQIGKTFYFTLKGQGGLTRNEGETKVSKRFFKKYWKLTVGNRIEKMRLKVKDGNNTAEFDVYLDRDLIVAEIEFPSEKAARRALALGLDITEEEKYKNRNLAR